MNHTTDFKVRINCMTYNHAPYIADTMNGFCLQKTDFPYVAIIVDDASSDREQDVINNYIHEHFDLEEKDVVRNEETDDYVLTFARHKENLNCFFAVFFLKYNHYSIKKAKWPYYLEFAKTPKYIALCEGDDYWTDATKLQQQVVFLDSHPDYSMCFHDVDIKAEKGREWYDVFGKLEDRDYTGLENLLRWSVPTCSMLLRQEISSIIPQSPKFTMGDNVLVLQCSRFGKIRCIPKKMGVYRLTSTSWIGGQPDKVQRYKYISHYTGLIEVFEECRDPRLYAILGNQYFQLLAILKSEGDKEEFERVKNEYINSPGEHHFERFGFYYRKMIIRRWVKKLLGKA